ncbi:unnamed protein product [Arctogadus glacialis]
MTTAHQPGHPPHRPGRETPPEGAMLPENKKSTCSSNMGEKPWLLLPQTGCLRSISKGNCGEGKTYSRGLALIWTGRKLGDRLRGEGDTNTAIWKPFSPQSRPHLFHSSK